MKARVLITIMALVVIMLLDAIRGMEYQARKKNIFGLEVKLPNIVRMTVHKEGNDDSDRF